MSRLNPLKPQVKPPQEVEATTVAEEVKVVQGNPDELLLEANVIKLKSLKPAYDLTGKEIDKIKADLKELFKKVGKTTYTAQGYTVTIQQSKSVSFNEEELLKYVKEAKLPVVKTIEMIDYDALESLVYNGTIDAAKIDKFKSVKITEKMVTKEA